MRLAFDHKSILLASSSLKLAQRFLVDDPNRFVSFTLLSLITFRCLELMKPKDDIFLGKEDTSLLHDYLKNVEVGRNIKHVTSIHHYTVGILRIYP